MGSEVTGVSSICNIIDYDRTKYQEALIQLSEASLEVDSILDDLPIDDTRHQNDRFNISRQTRDLQSEDEQLMVLEGLLNRWQERQRRLDEFDEPIDDAVEVGTGDETREPFGLMSQTNTLYTFDRDPNVTSVNTRQDDGNH